MRAQRLNEVGAAYIQDVLHVCTTAEPSISEKNKVDHLLKGIDEDVFNFLAQKNMSNVKEFVQECNRLPSVAVVQDCEGLPSNMQQLIREEVQRVLATMNIRPPYSPPAPSFEDMVQNEVNSFLAPSAAFPPPVTPMMARPFQSGPQTSFQKPANMLVSSNGNVATFNWATG